MASHAAARFSRPAGAHQLPEPVPRAHLHPVGADAGAAAGLLLQLRPDRLAARSRSRHDVGREPSPPAGRVPARPDGDGRGGPGARAEELRRTARHRRSVHLELPGGHQGVWLGGLCRPGRLLPGGRRPVRAHRPGGRSRAATVRVAQGLLAEHLRQRPRCRRLRGAQLPGVTPARLVRCRWGGAARVHLGWVGPADEPAVRGGLAGRHRRDRRLGLRGHRRRSTPLLVALLRDRDHAHPARLASHREQHHREQGQPPASPGPVRPRRHQPVHHRPGPALQPSLHVRGARAGARRRRRDGERHCRRAPQRALRADRRGRDRSGHRPPGIVGPPGAPVRCRERRRRHRRRPLVPDEERRAVRPDRVRLPRLASPLLAHVERPDGQLRLHTGELPPGSGPAE